MRGGVAIGGERRGRGWAWQQRARGDPREKGAAGERELVPTEDLRKRELSLFRRRTR